MAKEKVMQSANFKKDYVTALAIGLFFLMVISELFVAVSIPVTINHTTLYAEEGLRQKMLSSFDALRKQCIAKNKTSNSTVTMEKQFIKYDLDLLSSHLREYNTDMPISEVEGVLEDIQKYNVIMMRLNADEPNPFCKSENLDLSTIANRIEQKLNSNPEL